MGQWYYEREQAKILHKRQLYLEYIKNCWVLHQWDPCHYRATATKQTPESLPCLPESGWEFNSNASVDAIRSPSNLVIIDPAKYERALQRVLVNGTDKALPLGLYQGW